MAEHFVWPDDCLALVRFYGRILKDADKRTEMIRTSRVAGYGRIGEVEGLYLILRVDRPNAKPFHNKYPYEIFEIDGAPVRIGTWYDRRQEIYIRNEDVQSESNCYGDAPFAQSRILCTRIYFESEWHRL
jgi:hypothetical protein